jgi:hypothetical protein
VTFTSGDEGYGCGGGPPLVGNGGLTMTGQGYGWVRVSPGVGAGKAYFEVTVGPNSNGATSGSYGMLGVALDGASDPHLTCYPGYQDSTSDGWELITGDLYGTHGQAGWPKTTATANDVIGIYIDADASTVGFAKNGVFIGTAFTGLPAGALHPVLADSWPNNYAPNASYPGGNAVMTANFVGPFVYAIPPGYAAYSR